MLASTLFLDRENLNLLRADEEFFDEFIEMPTKARHEASFNEFKQECF